MRLRNINHTYYIKDGDTATKIKLQVLDYENQPFDLKSAEKVEVIIGINEGRLLTKEPALLDETGVLEFWIDEDDVLVVGKNYVEVHITTIDGRLQKAPSKGYYELILSRSIDTLGANVTKVTLQYFLDEVEKTKQDLTDEVENAIGYVDAKISQMQSDVQDAVQYTSETVNQVRQEFNEQLDATVSNKMTPFVDEVSANLAEIERHETSLKPMITIMTDDGRIQDYTLLKPFTEQYGIPFTSALISSRVGANADYMNLTHINELKALGWEFISHTHTHPHLSNLATESEIEAEISQCVEWLNANGLNSDYLVYPFSSYDNRVMKIAAKYHKASFAGRGINFAPLKPSQALPRVVFGGTDNLPGQDTLEFYLSQVDQAIAGNGWLVFVIHSAYESFDETQRNYLAQTIEYAQSKGVEFARVSDAYPIFKNVVETINYLGGNKYTYTALGANGDIYTNKMLSTTHQAAQISRTREVTATMRIDEIPNLPKGSHRYEMLHSVDNHGFPVVSGRLEIFRAPDTSDEAFSYQLLSGNDGTAYYRYWQSSNNKWSGWITYDYKQRLHIKRPNELTGLELPSEFSVGITMGELDTSQATAGGLPLGAPGLLITEKASNNAYVEQTYKHVNSNRMFVRGSNVNGDGWTHWQEVIKVEFLPADSITNTTAPSSNSLPVGVSYCEISDANDFPTGLAGLLITEKPSTSNYGQIKQTFKLHKSNRQFVRSGNFSTSWTAWFEINMTEFTP